MALPLEGIRILDLSRYLPGPFCTQILADFGAEVIKVEDPRGGDLGRSLPPLAGPESARFYTVNRNKKSVTLDLKKDDGKAIFKRLVEGADVVIDQFRPGVMDKMGLGYPVLKDINERLIYCAITGYGLTGPMRDVAGHDLNYLNLAGVTGQNGARGGKPAICGAQIADIAGGTLYAAIGILIALAGRQQSGKGQLVDMAMLDGSISLMAYTMGEWCGWGRLAEMGNDVLNGGYAFYQIYRTKDQQFVSLGAVEEKFFAEFCSKIGRPDFAVEQWNTERQAEIIAEIEAIIMEKTRDEWVEFMAGADMCFTPVLTLEEMTNHPQVKAREMISWLNNVNDSGKNIAIAGNPIKLSETPANTSLVFPSLGEHNQEILGKAGFSSEEIAGFKKEGII